MKRRRRSHESPDDDAPAVGVREAVAEFLTQGMAPEEAAREALRAHDYDPDHNMTQLKKAENYARQLLKQRSKEKGRVQYVPNLLGSEARLSFVTAYTPWLQSMRFELWGNTAPLFTSSAVEPLLEWLKASDTLEDEAHIEGIRLANPLIWLLQASESGAFPPMTQRTLAVSRAIDRLLKSVHANEWAPLIYEDSPGWLGAVQAAEWLLYGKYPLLPLASAIAPSELAQWGWGRRGQEDPADHSSDEALLLPLEQWGRRGQEDPVNTKIQGWPSPSRIGLGAITLVIFDPEAVSADAVRDLYKAAREASRVVPRGAPKARSTEVLAYLELDLVLQELRRRLASGERVDPSTWQWQPAPATLLHTWQTRAQEFDLNPNEIRTRAGVHAFQKRREYETYRPALRAEVSFFRLT